MGDNLLFDNPLCVVDRDRLVVDVGCGSCSPNPCVPHLLEEMGLNRCCRMVGCTNLHTVVFAIDHADPLCVLVALGDPVVAAYDPYDPSLLSVLNTQNCTLCLYGEDCVLDLQELLDVVQDKVLFCCPFEVVPSKVLDSENSEHATNHVSVLHQTGLCFEYSYLY